MFDIQDSTIQAFQELFEAQGAAPELVAETTVVVPVVSGLDEVDGTKVRVYPNPAPEGVVTVEVPAAAQAVCGSCTPLKDLGWHTAVSHRPLGPSTCLLRQAPTSCVSTRTERHGPDG